MWCKGVLDSKTPKGLLRAVFFYNGKNSSSVVDRRTETYRLANFLGCIAQIDIYIYMYIEKSSKNHAGGLAQLRLEHKTVPICSVPSAGDRCHVRLLDLYLSKLPANAKEKDKFYCEPILHNTKNGDVSWYSSIPCGENYLGKMVSKMFTETGEKRGRQIIA